MYVAGYGMKDHPRVCGEQFDCYFITLAKVGSPPRVRGTGPGGLVGLAVLGITPACAGNRAFPAAGHGRGEDHPRVCGEQRASQKRSTVLAGSPPRVRGTVRGASWIIHRDRITPACAGNSAIRTVAGAFPADHPRVCGEKLGGGAMKAPFAGSPPRVRGKEQPQPVGASNQRITPACAGNRLSSGDSSRAV